MIIVGQQLQFLGNRVLFQFISVLQRSRRSISLAGGVIFPHKLPAQAIPIAPAFAHCFFIFWDTHRSGSQHPFPCLRSLIDGKTTNTKCSQFNLPRGTPTRLGGRVGAHITCLSVCKCFVGYTQHYLTILRTMVRFVGGCCSDRAMQRTCHRWFSQFHSLLGGGSFHGLTQDQGFGTGLPPAISKLNCTSATVN